MTGTVRVGPQLPLWGTKEVIVTEKAQPGSDERPSVSGGNRGYHGVTGSALDSPFANGFRVALEDWTDERHLSRSQVFSLWVVGAYLENVFESQGWVLNGHSWKASAPMGTMVVKATVDGIPVVCFTSARTFVNAVSIFVRKLSEDSINWVKDKFRA